MSFEHKFQGFSTGSREHVRNAGEKKNQQQHEMSGRGGVLGVLTVMGPRGVLRKLHRTGATTKKDPHLQRLGIPLLHIHGGSFMKISLVMI